MRKKLSSTKCSGEKPFYRNQMDFISRLVDKDDSGARKITDIFFHRGLMLCLGRITFRAPKTGSRNDHSRTLCYWTCTQIERDVGAPLGYWINQARKDFCTVRVDDRLFKEKHAPDALKKDNKDPVIKEMGRMVSFLAKRDHVIYSMRDVADEVVLASAQEW